MPPLHPARHRRAKAAIIAVIAMHTVIDHALQRGVDRRRSAEIHIGNPQRNAAVQWHTIATHSVPFLGMGAAAVNHLVEINHQQSVPGRSH